MKTYFLEGKVEKTTNFAAGVSDSTMVQNALNVDVREVALSSCSSSAPGLSFTSSPNRNTEYLQGDVSRVRYSTSPQQELRSPAFEPTGSSPRRSTLTDTQRTRGVVWNGDTCIL